MCRIYWMLDVQNKLSIYGVLTTSIYQVSWVAINWSIMRYWRWNDSICSIRCGSFFCKSTSCTDNEVLLTKLAVQERLCRHSKCDIACLEGIHISSALCLFILNFPKFYLLVTKARRLNTLALVNLWTQKENEHVLIASIFWRFQPYFWE